MAVWLVRITRQAPIGLNYARIYLAERHVLDSFCRDASEPAAMQHGVGEGFGYFVIVAHKKVASEAAC